MSIGLCYAVAGIGLCALGLFGWLATAELLRRILAFNVLGSGTFLMLVGLAPPAPDGSADPVPQALVLTGIVVAVAATALALALMRRWYQVSGSICLPEAEQGANAPLAEVAESVPVRQHRQ